MGPHLPAKSASDRRVKVALALLQENFGDHALTLSSIAARVSLSASRLRHLIKLETGVSFSVLLSLARVRAAAGYLRNSSLSVKEVAFRVGYDNLWALDRHFKADLDCTPTEYRTREEAREAVGFSV
jgi:two-component system response regulator YesN